MKMNSDTPALELRKKDWDFLQVSFRECFAALLKERLTFRNVLDIRYGLGGWANVLREMKKPDYYLGFEAHWETYRAAKATLPPGVLLVNEKFSPERAIEFAVRSPIDLVLADFNNFTMLKSQPLMEALQYAKPKAVIFTDIASSKLHLNYRSYLLKAPDLGQYFEQFREMLLPRWSLVHIASPHRLASTVAFRKEKR